MSLGKNCNNFITFSTSSQIHFRKEGLWEKTHFHFKVITSGTLHFPGTDCEGKEPCPRGLLCSTGTPKRKWNYILIIRNCQGGKEGYFRPHHEINEFSWMARHHFLSRSKDSRWCKAELAHFVQGGTTFWMFLGSSLLVGKTLCLTWLRTHSISQNN